MNVFLDILKFIFFGLLAIVVAVIIGCWITASIETLHYTKQNNLLFKELCIKNGINVDSALNVIQNDTLNVKIKFVED
jgi:hypothetical protein